MDVSIVDRLNLLLHYARTGYLMGYAKHDLDYEIYINIDVDAQTFSFEYAGFNVILPIDGLDVRLITDDSILFSNYTKEISIRIPRTVLELVI